MRKILGFVSAGAVLFGALIMLPTPASAANAADFQPGRIIDDQIFYDSNAYTVADIQNFLADIMDGTAGNGANVACDTQGNKPYYGTYGGRSYNGNILRKNLDPNYPPPYICVKDYYENPTTHENNLTKADKLAAPIPAGGISAAQIIYNAAQNYGINPKVLIVMIQKESSGPLLTDDWPWYPQYKTPMGYGCPDTAACDSTYFGFYNQVWNAARQFRVYTNNPNSYNYAIGPNNIKYNPNAACGTKPVNIVNQATTNLYIYTPYTPNAAALANLYGTGDGCSAYGNRNFWRMFTDWFGTTFANIYNGVDYSPVFDAQYYLDNNADLKAAFGNNYNAAFSHFITKGMTEGRQAIADFNVYAYKNRYQDLRLQFGTYLPSYYLHYVIAGRQEGRIATGNPQIVYISSYLGTDYSSVYDFPTYIANNLDISSIYKDDDAGAIKHFIQKGMSEGRVASGSFNVNSYKSRYFDLRNVFGADEEKYYLHYINFGKNEGRLATGNYIGGTTKLNGVDYSPVYELNYYETTYSDIQQTFGLNDVGALNQFVAFGMNEGRIASANFNVNTYKNRYPDLRAAYGDNTRMYYLHYLKYGIKEGRLGT